MFTLHRFWMDAVLAPELDELSSSVVLPERRYDLHLVKAKLPHGPSFRPFGLQTHGIKLTNYRGDVKWYVSVISSLFHDACAARERT